MPLQTLKPFDEISTPADAWLVYDQRAAVEYDGAIAIRVKRLWLSFDANRATLDSDTINYYQDNTSWDASEIKCKFNESELYTVSAGTWANAGFKLPPGQSGVSKCVLILENRSGAVVDPIAEGLEIATPANGLDLTGRVLSLDLATAESPGAATMSDATPQAPGTASAGTSGNSSRADHRHASEKDKTAKTGILYGDGSDIAAAPTGTDRLVDVLFDYTLSATDLPTWSASADAGTDVVTFTGHTPTNGEAYYIEGGTAPTFGDAVNRAFSSEIIGPVVYAVNSSGSTCKLASTKGGTALDITNAGSGWTLRLAGLDSVNITGISIASGTTFQATMESAYGWGWVSNAAATCGLRINGDTGSRYKYSGTEATQWLFDLGNAYAYAAYELRNIGRAIAGRHSSIGLYGTSGLNADSGIGGNSPGSVMYAADAALTVTSMMFYRPSSSTTVGNQFKLGTRFQVRKIG